MTNPNLSNFKNLSKKDKVRFPQSQILKLYKTRKKFK
jgi:hypothetical protein